MANDQNTPTTEELVVKKLERSLIVNSTTDKDSKSPTIDAFLRANENVMLLVDTSYSMADKMLNGKRRIDGLRDVVYGIWNEGPITTIAFGGTFGESVRFVDNVPDPSGSTPLHAAISLARDYGATRLVVVSDGQPDLPHLCIEEAKKLNGKIDVVFVGDPGDRGRPFLQELALMTGGKEMTGDLTQVKELQRGIIGLLEGGTEERGPIQGAGFTAEAAEPPLDDDDESDDDSDDDDDDDDDEDDDGDEDE